MILNEKLYFIDIFSKICYILDMTYDINIFMVSVIMITSVF